MEEFDINMNFNGVNNDLIFLNLDGEKQEENTQLKTNTKENKDKPNWVQGLDKITNTIKDLTSYETPAQREARLKKEKEEMGKKTTILGMNPLVAIAISFALIVGGVVAVIKLKGK